RKPFELAEHAHPAEVWFELNISNSRFKDGLEEMNKLAHMGFSNFKILLSGLKDPSDIYRVRLIAAEQGFSFGMEIPFGILVEYPAMALSYEAISKAGASFALMDIDTLSKRILFSEKTPDGLPDPVAKVMEDSITHFKGMRMHVSARGNMLENAAVIKELTNLGIDSVVSHPDKKERLKLKLLHAEKSHEIDFLKAKMRMHLKSRA
ncbi:MAG: hypothetical protein KKE71_03040, partial [Nanoarchaeota archaeon]|nr:hypothetical protein [Nanoarchaeota archaeon]